MKLYPILMAAIPALIACSADSGSDPLIGSWGGPSLLVTATATGADIALSCGATIHIDHPIVLDANGEFVLHESMRGSFDGTARDTLPDAAEPITITGARHGDTIALAIFDRYSGSASTLFTGRRGMSGPPSDEVCRV